MPSNPQILCFVVEAFAPGLFVAMVRAGAYAGPLSASNGGLGYTHTICCGTHGADFCAGSGHAELWTHAEEAEEGTT